MSNLLIAEHPLLVLPSLAAKIGLNEAIVLQQIHYWLRISPKYIDGRPWIYNSAAEWRKQFPFWSEPTIRRIVVNLKQKGIIDTAHHSNDPADRTLWYTINYDKVPSDQSDHMGGRPSDQSDHMGGRPSDQSDHTQVINVIRSYTETTTENNSTEKRESARGVTAKTKPAPPTDPRVRLDDPTSAKPRTRSPPKNTQSSRSHSKTGDFDPRKVREGLIPQGLGLTPLEVWREGFDWMPTAAQRRELRERVTDLKKWREVIKETSLAGFRSFANVLDVYLNGWKESSNVRSQRTDRHGAAKPAYANYNSSFIAIDPDREAELNGWD